eukprot:10876554-Alexandrium_andersonii.AAC.1
MIPSCAASCSRSRRQEESESAARTPASQRWPYYQLQVELHVVCLPSGCLRKTEHETKGTLLC